MALDEVPTPLSDPLSQMKIPKPLHSQVFDLVWRDFRLHLVDFSTNLLDNHALADVKLICDGGKVSNKISKQTNKVYQRRYYQNMTPFDNGVVYQFKQTNKLLNRKISH